MRSDLGVTLLELLVVLVLLGSLAAVATPMITLRTEEPGTSARELVRIFGWARKAAALQGRPTTVELDPRNGTFRIDLFGEQAGPVTVRSGELPTTSASLSWRADRGDQGSGALRVMFEPSGRSSGATVQLWTASGRRAEVTVERWTGRSHAAFH